jgi:DNA polymerase-3 subunit alpha
VLEFLVACLNLDVSDQNKVNLFIHEARDNNIKILSPDINLSKAEFTIFEEMSEKKILFGFTAIKAVSKNVGLYIQSENERKKFTNIFDFIERIPGKLLNKRSLENLILAGCFDKLHGNRKQLLASLELIMAHGSISEKEKQANQFSLMPNNYTTQKLKEIGEDFAPMQKAEYEFDLLGVFLTYHPIEYYEDFLKEMGAFSSKKLANLYKGSSGLKIAGVIQKKDSRISDKGVFVSIQLSDNYGIFDVTIFGDKILETYGNLLEVKKKVVVTCEAYKDNTSTRLTVVAIEDLDELIGKTTGDDLFLTAHGDEQLQNILDFLKTKRDDNANRINIEIAIPIKNSPFAGRATINDQFNLSIKDIKELKNI